MALKISEMFAGAVPHGQTFTQGTVQPVNPVPGDEWLDESSGVLFTFVNDGNAGQWMELGPSPATSVNTVAGRAGDVVLTSADIAQPSSYTFATLPNSGVAVGSLARVTDYGDQFADWIYTGTRWRPKTPMIAHKAVSGFTPALDTDLTNKTIYSFVIPAGVLAQGDTLRFLATASATNDAIVKTLGIRITDGVNTTVSTYVAGLSNWAGTRAVGHLCVTGINQVETTYNQTTGYGTGNQQTWTLNLNSPLTVNVTGNFNAAGTGTKDITLKTLVLEHLPF